MPSEGRVRLQLYGIRNCDSCRRALQWLKSRGADHEFHDLREAQLSRGQLDDWLASQHGPSLINRRSTTWRGLTEDECAFTSDNEAIELLVNNPTLIQRPVLEHDGKLLMNFSDTTYADFFK